VTTPPPASLTHDPLLGHGDIPTRPTIVSAVRSLEPTRSVDELLSQPRLPRKVIESAVGEIPAAVVAWVVEETSETVEVIEGFYPQVPDLPVDSIARATECTLLQICLTLAGGHLRLRFTDEYRSFSRDAARRRTHVRLIVDAMRLVQQRWVEKFLATFSFTPSAADLQHLLTVTAQVFDAVVDTFLGEYLTEKEEQLAGQLVWRRATVQALCAADSTVDAELVRSQLGLDISRHHLGLVLWFPGMAAGYELERVAKQFSTSLHHHQTLLVPVEDGQLWVWFSFAASPRPETIDYLRQLTPSVPGVRVAMGSPASGAAGFRRSHLQARDVAGAVQDSNVEAAVVTWSETRLMTIFGHDIERACWFVESSLGPLSLANDHAAEQRSTLLSYIESNQSLLQTAAAQHVHRNTIVYRIRRIEESLAKPIAPNRTELHCALQLIKFFGSRVLQT